MHDASRGNQLLSGWYNLRTAALLLKSVNVSFLFNLTGTLPASWSEPGAFASLTSLTLDLSNLSGTLPPSWGGNGLFPVLDSLSLGPELSPGFSLLAGPLPPEWSSPAAFPMLTSLSITNLSITGEPLHAGSMLCMLCSQMNE